LQTKKKTPTTNENQQEDKPPSEKPKSLRFDPALKATIEDESDEEDY
jgi:hypothetical protein